MFNANTVPLMRIGARADQFFSRFNAEIGAIRRLNLSGVYDVHTNMMQVPATMQPTQVRFEQVANSAAASDSARFPPLDPKIPRNFKVIDTYMESPPAGLSSAIYEQRDVPSFLAEFQGLEAVPKDILDELPSECRDAFAKAVDKERAWRSKWGPESIMAHRRPPIIDAAIVPYSRM